MRLNPPLQPGINDVVSGAFSVNKKSYNDYNKAFLNAMKRASNGANGAIQRSSNNIKIGSAAHLTLTDDSKLMNRYYIALATGDTSLQDKNTDYAITATAGLDGEFTRISSENYAQLRDTLTAQYGGNQEELDKHLAALDTAFSDLLADKATGGIHGKTFGDVRITSITAAVEEPAVASVTEDAFSASSSDPVEDMDMKAIVEKLISRSGSREESLHLAQGLASKFTKTLSANFSKMGFAGAYDTAFKQLTDNLLSKLNSEK